MWSGGKELHPWGERGRGTHQRFTDIAYRHSQLSLAIPHAGTRCLSVGPISIDCHQLALLKLSKRNSSWLTHVPAHTVCIYPVSRHCSPAFPNCWWHCETSLRQKGVHAGLPLVPPFHTPWLLFVSPDPLSHLAFQQ